MRLYRSLWAQIIVAMVIAALLPLVAAVALMTSEAYVASVQSRQAILAIGLIAILGALMLAWIFSRLLVRPLEHLARVAYSIAQGDKREVPLLGGSSEVANLSRSLAMMVDALTDRTMRLAVEWDRTQRIIETVIDGIALVGLDGHITYANAGAERILGLSRDDLTQRGLFDVAWEYMTPDGRPLPELQDLFAQHVQGGEPLRGIKIAVRCGDGVRRIVSVDAAYLPGTSGRTDGIVLSFKDVTESEQMTEALRESEGLKRAILETALDAVISIDQYGTVVEFNRAAEKIFGYRHGEVLGKPMADLLIPPSLRAGHVEGLARYLASGEGPLLNKRVETSAMRADGTEFPVELAITPTSAGDRSTFTAFIRDLSDRRRAEKEHAQLAREQAQLAQEQAARAQVEEHHRRLEVLYESTKQIRERLDLDHVLATVLAATRQLFGADRAAIYHEGESGAYTCLASFGLSPDYVETICRHFRRAVIGHRTIATRHWALVEDLAADPPPDRMIADAVRKEGIQANLAMPLLRQGEVIGTLSIYHDRPHWYRDDELQAAQALADQAAVAIEQARENAQRTLAAEALRVSNETLRAVIEASPMAIVATDLDANVTMWNPAAERTFGWTEQETLGRMLPYIRADQTDEYRALHQRRLAGEIIAGEQRRQKRDGTPIDVSVSSSPLRSARGDVAGLVAIVTDITERKRAEERLKLQGAALEAASNAIFITDYEGRILWVNPAFTALTGYTLEEAIGKTPRILKSDQHDEAYYRRLWETITSGRVWRGEMVDRRKDGSLYFAEQTVTPVCDEQGKTCHFVAIKQDVSERHQLEEQVRQAQKMEAIGQLAGGVAHDFNNLLTVINGFSELVLSGLEETSPWYSSIQEIAKAGESAQAVTRQLLVFSRRQVTEPKILDLNAVLANTETMLRRLIREDIELVVSLEPALKPVQCDPGQIEQVTMNLVVNARDAMPTGGRLGITTANSVLGEAYARTHVGVRPGPYVMLSLTDTGVGMDAATLERIFEPFFTTKEKGKGTGLGLSVVYGIVRQAGGHIDVESQPGLGTTFTIYLPEAQASTEATRAVDTVTELPAGSGTVLVVEDDEKVRLVARQALQANGYTVLEASNGEDAVKAAAQYAEPIHLLLTDVVMPRLGGRELARQLVALRPEMKTLYMSGYADDDVLRRDVVESGTPFLPKPFTPATLLQKVHRVLGVVWGAP